MAKEQKRYTIYIKNVEKLRPFACFNMMQKSFAMGAMAMAEAFCSKKYHFVLKCDQTDQIISEVEPSKIHLN